MFEDCTPIAIDAFICETNYGAVAIVVGALIYWIGAAGFVSWLAHAKGRAPLAWFVGGLFFNLFAMLALIGAPALEPNGRAKRLMPPGWPTT